MMNDKPNCYECKHRGRVAGSAHSECRHPDANLGLSSDVSLHDMGIRAKKHGIDKGWFYWPYNFDPVWLMSCNGFTEKVEVKDPA